MDSTLPAKRVVLLGIGHTNAHVLRMWRMSAPEDAELVCISNYPYVTYSGMLPGTLAGLYHPDRMTIDLVRLCAAAGTRLIVGSVTGVDVAARQVLLEDRPPFRFDVLSIGIGSVPTREGVESLDDTLLPIKPMQTFVQRLEAFVESWLQMHTSDAAGMDRPFEVAVVGGGVAGTEIALCLPARLRSVLGARPFSLTIVERGEELCDGLSGGARRRAEDELRRREVRVLLGRTVHRVEAGRVVFHKGGEISADLVLWATGAAAPPLLDKIPLPKDERGFLLTHTTLQSVGDDRVFAVGDTGTMQDERGEPIRLPKAGVYAVRQGPVLWNNVRQLLAGRPLEEYQPQRGFLRLLATGDGRAILDYKGLAAHARWCWRLKDYIDGRFMDKYQDYRSRMMHTRPTSRPERDDSAAQDAMRCAGCGGKIGAAVLSGVLRRLDIVEHPLVAVGLSAPDDAAVLRGSPECHTVVTTDFFASPLDDPYVVGRIAAVNALSDVFAMGGTPNAALAHVAVPVGKGTAQEELLYELLAGGVRELNAHKVALVGGHTIEGPRLTIGFTVLGCVKPARTLSKGGLRAGDVLLLTKPLGTGILLAALMQAKLRWPWHAPLVDSMLRPNAVPVDVLIEAGVQGVTDVTGFGLAGHLREMLSASGVAAELDLNQLPLIPGVRELIEEGVESTLAPANRDAASDIDVTHEKRATPEYAALFDPQTSGGLLLGVPAEKSDELRRRLEELLGGHVATIGRVVATQPGRAAIRITP